MDSLIFLDVARNGVLVPLSNSISRRILRRYAVEMFHRITSPSKLRAPQAKCIYTTIPPCIPICTTFLVSKHQSGRIRSAIPCQIIHHHRISTTVAADKAADVSLNPSTSWIPGLDTVLVNHISGGRQVASPDVFVFLRT